MLCLWVYGYLGVEGMRNQYGDERENYMDNAPRMVYVFWGLKACRISREIWYG